MYPGDPLAQCLAHGGHREDADGLMDEQDDIRVVPEAEQGPEKASCPGVCGNGHVAWDAACSRTRQERSLTSPPLLVFEYVLTHPGMFLETQRSWTVYLQSGKKKDRKKVLVSGYLGRFSRLSTTSTATESVPPSG